MTCQAYRYDEGGMCGHTADYLAVNREWHARPVCAECVPTFRARKGFTVLRVSERS